MSASNDGSESVDQFLARIASLSRRNDDEEAERSRRVEEEMMQARKERRARREERARSISPVKTGPAATMSSPRTVASPERSIEPPVTFTPRSQTQTPTRRERSQSPLASESLNSSPIEASRPLPRPPLEKPTTPSFPSTNVTTLSRSGTLSWQQRPSSRDGPSVRSRPLSGAREVFREPAERQAETPKEKDKPEPSRADIAASLGARDPSWFRQTADRGIGSAAYRRNNEEVPSTDIQSSRGMRLPGMAEAGARSGQQQNISTTNSASSPSAAPSKPDRPLPDEASGRLQSSVLSGSRPLSDALTSSLDPLPAQEDSIPLKRTSTILSSAGRPPSPTKGLGGFVQSAMMKRSDSVSKRWSVQANAGLKRGDSVASSRPAFNPPAATPSLGQAVTITRDSKVTRDGTTSPLSSSRPASSHGPENPISGQSQAESHEVLPNVLSATQPPETFVRERPTTPPSEPLLSRSPSKTLDPRRWSPTKASWLESALSKPESPRPTAVKPELPAWKISLDRSRNQRDLERSPTRPPSFDPVSTGGLLRSPPPGSPTKTHASLATSTSFTTRQRADPTTEPARENFSATPDAASSAAPPVAIQPPTEKDSKTASIEKVPSRKQTPDVSEEALAISTRNELLPSANSPAEIKPDSKTNIDQKPPAVKPKPKPQTPPKTDFRAALRSRQAENIGSDDKEPEFKAAFGKLKRTQTQNYEAPDIFKQNITRGKAALTVTGGPQKTKRVDEFKESILQRKDEMKAGGGSIHKRSESQTARDAMPKEKDGDVPEALARRTTLHKTKASSDVAAERPTVLPPKPVAPKPVVIAPPKADTAAMKATPPKSGPAEDKSSAINAMKPPGDPVGKVEAMQPASKLANAGSAASLPIHKPAEKASFLPPSEPISRTTSASPNKELTKTASNKLAARLNPALAGLIARGGSPRPANDNTSSDAPLDPRIRLPTSSALEDGVGSTGLTHMTKARAKGPKRRAPKAEPAPSLQSSEPANEVPEQAIVAVKPISLGKGKADPLRKTEPFEAGHAPPKPRPVTSPKPSVVQKPAVISPEPTASATATAPANVDQATEAVRDKPRIASKSPELRRVSDNHKVTAEHAGVSPPKVSLSTQFDIATDKSSRDVKPVTPRRTESPVRSSTKSMPLTPSKTKVNSPKMPNPAVDSPVLKATPKTGLGLNFNTDAKRIPAASELTPPPEKEIRARGSTSKGDSAEMVLLDFFGVMPKSSERLDFDTENFLKAQSNQIERVKTLSNKIVEITGDGKQSPMSPSQEHILYEESMYLCVHSFEANGSKVTEVYLWAGDAVAEAALEDAQIFCKKVGRENSTKLEMVKQGKESARFLSAVGGILIIRKSKSSALYMLCGRRHGGHVVFDEVDFAPSNLCSGFSFLISAKFGKLYLWIGAGSCADEYGAARLIGTDLGLTGEIEEVSEGKEPASFWESFSAPSARRQARPSEMWSMRASSDHNGFPCRLYRMEQERPKSSGGFWGLRASSPPKSSNKASLQEISPFSQQDLDGSYVHLLDTYAAIYVVPGRPSPSKPVDFVSALHIAQELAVLTPSMQDRALLPSCRIVFGEPPHDFKVAFRKWTPGVNVRAGGRSACLDVADVMRVLG